MALTDAEVVATDEYQELCRRFDIDWQDAPDVQLTRENRRQFWLEFDELAAELSSV